MPDALQGELGRLAPRLAELGRDEAACQQEVARLLAERRDIDGRAMREGAHAAHGMHASDEASQPLERFAILELGSAPAAAREHRKAEAHGLQQRAAAELA